ncbi:MAG: hypothetical protein ACE3L7_01825 [Candidatus Pristimantibacillus sp.]
MKEISNYIRSELALIKDNFIKGVYSIEFTLGHLASLHHLAVHFHLNGLKEDIRYIVKILPDYKNQKTNDQRVNNPDAAIFPSHKGYAALKEGLHHYPKISSTKLN